MLLLHGFPEFWYGFRHQLRALGDSGFRAIALDLPGYNLSDKPKGARSYGHQQIAACVAAFVRALGCQRVSLCGHDWGGLVAWALAGGEHRGLVERLCILNCPHPALFMSHMSLRQLRRSWYMLLFQLPGLPEWLLRRNDFQAVADSLRMITQPGTLSDEDIARFKAAAAQPGALTAALNYYRAMGRRSPLRLARDFGQVEAKTLLIWGESDRAFGKELTYGTAMWAPNLRIEYLPDAGHSPHQAQPAAVNRLLLDFLRAT